MSTLPHGVGKTPLDTSPSLKSLLLHCKQINRVRKNKVDGQISILLAYIQAFDYKLALTQKILALLELETRHCH